MSEPGFSNQINDETQGHAFLFFAEGPNERRTFIFMTEQEAMVGSDL